MVQKNPTREWKGWLTTALLKLGGLVGLWKPDICHNRHHRQEDKDFYSEKFFPGKFWPVTYLPDGLFYKPELWSQMGNKAISMWRKNVFIGKIQASYIWILEDSPNRCYQYIPSHIIFPLSCYNSFSLLKWKGDRTDSWPHYDVIVTSLAFQQKAWSILIVFVNILFISISSEPDFACSWQSNVSIYLKMVDALIYYYACLCINAG